MSLGKPVTDPALLAELNGQPVTDPAILNQLEGEESPLSDNLAAIDAQLASEEFEEPSTFEYLFNRIKKGFAGFMGLPGDIVHAIRTTPGVPPASTLNRMSPEELSAMNLAAQERARTLQSTTTPVMATSGQYREAFGHDPGMKTHSDALRYTGGVAEMAAAGGPFALATKPAQIPALVTSTFGSGIGLEAGGDVAEGLGFDRQTGEAIGAGMGGFASAVAPNAASTAAGSIKRRFSPSAQKAQAESAVGREITEQLDSYPPSRANIDRSLEISDDIPGFEPTLPARSGAPGLIAEEKRLVSMSPKTLNRAVQNAEENRRAITSYVEGKFPAAGGETAAARVAKMQKQAMTRLEGMKAAVDDKLDDAVRVFETNPTNAENGARLRDLFFKQKEVYSGMRGQKYQEVYESAERLGVKAKIDDAVEYVDDVLKNEMNSYQQSEIPSVFREIKRSFKGDEAVPPTGRSIPPDLMVEAEKAAKRSTEISFAELHSLYKRTNKDLASLRGSMAADKDFRIMLLEGLKTRLNQKIAAFEGEGFGEVAVKLKEANRFYAQEYLPRFKQGFGSDLAARYPSGEFRTADQMITSMVTKANNTQAARDFKLLFDDIPEAHSALRAGYLDELYRNTGVIGKDGRINQRALDTFLRKHEPTLKEFPEIRKELRTLALDNEALLARRAHLVAAEKKLAANDLFKLFQGRDPNVILTEATTNKNAMRVLEIAARRDPNMAKGLARGIAEHVTRQQDPAAFLAANEEAIRIGLRPLGQEHFRNLKTAVEALTINSRNPASVSVQPGSVNPDAIAERLGSSPRAMISHYLNVQRGRTGAAQEATAFLGRWFDKLRRDHRTVAMEAVFYDRDTARALANLARNPASEKAKLDFATQMTALGVRVETAGQE